MSNIKWDKSSQINWITFNPPERSRTYIYSDGLRLTFENVTKIEVQESGKHRLETTDGQKAFIPPGWVGLAIDTDEWTF